jgi:uncharacterized protein YgiB involved in biofilm formation
VSGLRPLALRALGLTPLLALAGCDDGTPALRIYPSVEACQAEYNADDCARAFAGAQAAHVSSAPTYPALDVCEQIYGPGGCMPRGDLGAAPSFMPIMTGFLIGQALAGVADRSYQPIYVDRQGMAYAGGAVIGTYRRDCIGNACTAGSSGYIFSSGGSGHGGFWSGSHYTVHSMSTRSWFSKPFSHSASAFTEHSSGVSRGGFGSIAHAIGHIGS